MPNSTDFARHGAFILATSKLFADLFQIKQLFLWVRGGINTKKKSIDTVCYLIPYHSRLYRFGKENAN